MVCCQLKRHYAKHDCKCLKFISFSRKASFHGGAGQGAGGLLSAEYTDGVITFCLLLNNMCETDKERVILI